MNIELERPLVGIDLEANSTDPQDALIFEIALRKWTGTFSPSPMHDPEDEFIQYVYPEDGGIDIPDRVLELTNTSIDELKKHGRPWHEIGPRVHRFIEGADLYGFNSISYDVRVLRRHFEMIGKEMPPPTDRRHIDAYNLERAFRRQTLESLYSQYVGEEFDAHNAAEDIIATERLLAHQMLEHEFEAETIEELADVARGEFLDDYQRFKREEIGGEEYIVFGFGKLEGKPLRKAVRQDHDYLKWMMNEIPDTRAAILAFMPPPMVERMKPQLHFDLSKYERWIYND